MAEMDIYKWAVTWRTHPHSELWELECDDRETAALIGILLAEQGRCDIDIGPEMLVLSEDDRERLERIRERVMTRVSAEAAEQKARDAISRRA